MKLQLNISDAEYVKTHETVESNNSLLSKIESITFIKNLTLVQEYGKVPQKIENVFLKHLQIIKNRKGIFIFQNEALFPYSITLIVSAGKTYINWLLEIEASNENIQSKINFLINSFKEFYKALNSEVSIGLVTSIRIIDVNYKAPKPTKFWRFYDKQALVDIVNKSALNPDFKDMYKITHKLMYEELPKGVFREKINNNVCIINWFLTNKSDDIGGLLRFRAEWIQENSDFILDSSYNIHQDKEFVTYSQSVDSYFTFVDTFTGRAFKGIVPYFDNQIQLEKMLKKIIEYKSTNFKEVYLITPTRSTAIKITEQAIKIGFSGVLYSDDLGHLWVPELE